MRKTKFVTIYRDPFVRNIQTLDNTYYQVVFEQCWPLYLLAELTALRGIRIYFERGMYTSLILPSFARVTRPWQPTGL